MKAEKVSVLNHLNLSEKDYYKVKNAAENPVHAYLFTGKEELLEEIARSFFALLVCSNRGCGECPDCKMALEGKHPDLIFVYPEGQNILVNQAREINKWAHEKPLETKKRLIVLAEAHLMNTEAANTLLKVLEEPPPSTVFVLIKEPDGKLLPTIRSRLAHLSFQTSFKEESSNVPDKAVFDLISSMVAHEGWTELEEDIKELVEKETNKVVERFENRINFLRQLDLDRRYFKWIEKIENARTKRKEKRIKSDIVRDILEKLLSITNKAIEYKLEITDLTDERPEVYDNVRNFERSYKLSHLKYVQETILEALEMIKSGVSPENVLRGFILKLWQVS